MPQFHFFQHIQRLEQIRHIIDIAGVETAQIQTDQTRTGMEHSF